MSNFSSSTSTTNATTITATTTLNQNANESRGRLSIIHDIYESLQLKFGTKKKAPDILPKYEDVINRNDSKIKFSLLFLYILFNLTCKNKSFDFTFSRSTATGLRNIACSGAAQKNLSNAI